jgi:hypothetical protein
MEDGRTVYLSFLIKVPLSRVLSDILPTFELLKPLTNTTYDECKMWERFSSGKFLLLLDPKYNCNWFAAYTILIPPKTDNLKEIAAKKVRKIELKLVSSNSTTFGRKTVTTLD